MRPPRASDDALTQTHASAIRQTVRYRSGEPEGWYCEGRPGYLAAVFSALIIDADAKTPTVIQDMLAAYRFEFTVTENGPEAVNVARTVAPNIIFIRAELPLTSGFSVCNRLRRNNQTRQIPIIIYASSVSQDVFDQHRNLKTHADGYLKMPLDGDVLVETVRPLLTIGESASGEPASVTKATEDRIEQRMDGDRSQGSSERSGRRAVEEFNTIGDSDSHGESDAVSRDRTHETSGFRVQREVLEIRATLNAKKREILSLRDEIENRDRAILDAGSRNRKLQTVNSDLEGQLLEVQEKLLSARESLDALSRDRATGRKREEGFKARLERMTDKFKDIEAEYAGAQTSFEQQQEKAAKSLVATIDELSKVQDRVARLETERDALTTQLMAATSEAASLSEELADKRQAASQLEASLAELQLRTDEERQDTAAEHTRITEELRSAYEGHIHELKEGHAIELAEAADEHQSQLLQAEQSNATLQSELRETHAAQLAALKELHELEIGDLRQHQEQAIVDLQEQAGGQLSAARAEHEARVEELTTDHQAEITGLQEVAAEIKASLESQLTETEQELADTRELAAADKLAAEQELTETRELAERSNHQLNQLLDETKAESERAIEEISNTLATSREQAAEALAELNLELVETKDTMGAEIERLAAALRDLEASTSAEASALQARIDDLEGTLADVEGRLGETSETLGARNNAGHRAQQALAVALKLLEEHTVAP